MRVALAVVMTAAICAGGWFSARWWRSHRHGHLGTWRALLVFLAVLLLVVVGLVGVGT